MTTIKIVKVTEETNLRAVMTGNLLMQVQAMIARAEHRAMIMGVPHPGGRILIVVEKDVEVS